MTAPVSTGTPSSDPAPGATPPADPPKPAPTAPSTPSEDPLVKALEEIAKWKGLSRMNEDAKKEALNKIANLETQVQTSTQDKLAVETTASQAVAIKDLHIALARAGVKKDDAEALASITDPSRLMEDGKPSEAAIDKVVKAFARSRPKGSADPDAGKGDQGKPSNDMNQLLRAAAGFAPS